MRVRGAALPHDLSEERAGEQRENEIEIAEAAFDQVTERNAETGDQRADDRG